MFRFGWLSGIWLGLMFAAVSLSAKEEIGELDIPPVFPLTQPQLDALRELARTDPEAKALAREAEAAARPLRDTAPRPLEAIHYEGLVNTDPRRIASVEHLRDMSRVSLLLRYWQVSGDARAAAALRRYVRAWTGTYRLTGNDVNENKLYPLLAAYHSLRSGFSEEERDAVDAWVDALGKLHKAAVEQSAHFTNRYSKHVRLLAVSGMILDREEWIVAAREGVTRFVTQSLYEDGSSYDLKHRDTLTYHASALCPVIELAMLAGDAGAALYAWTSPRGGSIRKSVEYVVPYAMGEKTREEWVRSEVDLDRRRAEAGLEAYRIGRQYDPQSALELMEASEFFDPELLRVVRHLTRSKAERFPTWQTLINRAMRGDGNGR